MIVNLNGKLSSATPSQATLDVHGVGYAVAIPLSTFSEIDGHSEGRLLIHHHFSQTGEQKLYGFYSEEERSMFKHLLSVTGVGGSSALLMLSGMSVDELQHAITSENHKMLEGIKGVGKKTAAQIILALKDKFPKVEAVSDTSDLFAATPLLRTQAVDGLMALGFKKAESTTAVENVMKQKGYENLTLSDIIRFSLQQLSK